MVNRFESIACEAHVFRERERKDVYHNIIISLPLFGGPNFFKQLARQDSLGRFD